jgi:hypothetical protein
METAMTIRSIFATSTLVAILAATLALALAGSAAEAGDGIRGFHPGRPSYARISTGPSKFWPGCIHWHGLPGCLAGS